MKIHSVTHNNRRKAFQVKTSKKTFEFPYSKVDPQPSISLINHSTLRLQGTWPLRVYLRAGFRQEGTVHSEQVLEYNQDPNYLRMRSYIS